MTIAASKNQRQSSQLFTTQYGRVEPDIIVADSRRWPGLIDVGLGGPSPVLQVSCLKSDAFEYRQWLMGVAMTSPLPLRVLGDGKLICIEAQHLFAASGGQEVAQ